MKQADKHHSRVQLGKAVSRQGGQSVSQSDYKSLSE